MPTPGGSVIAQSSPDSYNYYFEEECKRIHLKLNNHSQADRIQLFADMVHMHLNRVFVNDARKQEMILYYCLWRHYQSVKARDSIRADSAYS